MKNISKERFYGFNSKKNFYHSYKFHKLSQLPFLFRFCLLFAFTIFFVFLAKAQSSSTSHRYYINKSEKTTNLPKSKDSMIINRPPPDGCVINGSTTVTGGATYTYFIVCSDGFPVDFWEVTCGIALDYDGTQVTIKWDNSGCTTGTISAYTSSSFASKTVFISPAPPPPPPTITYTSLFNSTNFTKTIDLLKPVGVVNGSANVSNGAASYAIPIFSSPGTNGVQPFVSINYNSQASAGVVGYGWSISGLSVISRGGKDIFHNGIVQPVKYNTEDAFVLDGMRLSPVTGSNGSNGTIYASEFENFAKIISNTSASPNNPDWFQVINKDGSILEYGRTIDSRIKTDDGLNIMLWRLNRSIDINGNYIDYIYDNTDRDSRIKTIKYTANDNAGLSPSNFIDFNYALKTDQNTFYDGGSSVTSKYLLTDITITADIDEVVKRYQFNYGFDNINSFLKEVIEKGTDGTALNSTIFLYGDQPQNLSVSSTSILTGASDLFSGDYDADGKTDLLYADKYYDPNAGTQLYTKYSLLNNIEETSAGVMYIKDLPQHPSIESFKQARLFNFLTSDYDGDGRDDILQIDVSVENINCTEYRNKLNRVVVNLTKGFNDQTGYTDYFEQTYPFPEIFGEQYQYSSDKGNFVLPGDFDGDGNQDYISILAKKRIVSICNYLEGKSSYDFDFKSFITSPGTNEINEEIANFGVGSNPYGDFYARTIADADLITALDFNGDGKMELLITKDQQSYILSIQRVSITTGYSFAASVLLTTSAITKDSKYFLGDFNGDRKTDFLIRNVDGTCKILYSTGTSFNSVPYYFNQSVNINDDKIIVADFNGDGRSDILHGYSYYINGIASTSKLSFYYNKGNIGTSAFYYEQYDYPNILNSIVTGDFNGDGRTDILNRTSSFDPADFISIKPFGKEKLLTKVTNGYNVTTSFEYKSLTDKSSYPYFYNRTISLDDPANKNPYNYVELPMYAVSAISSPNGIGGINTNTFNYENAVIHRTGKGFLGFKKITSKDLTSGITAIMENNINTDFAVPYSVNQKTLLTSTSELLSESQITNSFVDLSSVGDKRFQQKIDKVLDINYLNGTASESVNTYDDYGNITTNVAKTGTLSGTTITPVETTTTTTIYGIHNTPVVAKPDNITISNMRSGMATVNKTTQFTYTTKGLVESKIDFAGLPKSITTSFSYNSLGNPIQTITSSAGLSSRISNITYDPRGVFAVTKQITGSGLSQTESFNYDYLFGNPISQTSSDCLTTSFEYDAFGRLKKTTAPEGYTINTSLIWDVKENNDFYSLTDYSGGKPDGKTWFDVLGRETKKETIGFNNQLLTQLITYDVKGNVATQTNSYFASETPLVTTNTYDVYNRLKTVANPLNTITTTYTKLPGGKFEIKTEDETDQSAVRVSDASGKIIYAIDNGGQLDYTYDSRGNQTQVKHGSNILITNTYDDYGRQTMVTDKNAGTVTYEYDAYGQLKKQTDNNGNFFSIDYDDFGRIIRRQGPEGNTSYEYYKDITTGCSNNNFSKIIGFNGVTKEYTFDNLKRPFTEKITVEGLPYITQYNYDIYGNLIKTTYPSGVVVNNIYGNNGELLSVTGGDATSPTTLFTGTQMNGFGNYTNYTLGNNKVSENTYTNGMPVRYYTQGIQDLNQTFDFANGNLLSRRDAIKNITENFEYDALKRLVKSTVNSVVQLNMAYDGSSSFSMGNIISKTDAGNYIYKTDKQNAVAYITNPAGAQMPPVNIATTEQNITYTPFLKTASIVEGPYQIDYTYNPDYERVKSILKQNSAIIETKYYLGNYEKQISGGITREIHYVSGGNGLCAMIVREGGINTFYFVYTDQLGSILTITDINGTKVADQNFDAWGRNRNPANWQYTSVPVNPTWLYRGYTGHEHLQQFALINMNGRMYDPIEGRMLSPDNYVADAFNTQGYNRYSYGMNNPLSYVDPDGNFAWFVPIIIGATIGAMAGGIQADMQGRSFLSGAWKGAIVGGAGGALSLVGGGSFLANVAWGAGEGIVTNGLSNILNGQNIFDGMGAAALWGGGFAALSSGIESIKNYKDGYGFGTNKGRLNEMIKDYKASLGTQAENINANTAIGFVKERYGLDGANFFYDKNSFETAGAYGVTTPDATNNIFIDPKAFGSSSLLKATLVHEYGHLMLDKIVAGGQFMGWRYNNYANSLNNATLSTDGPLGYAQEIYNSGKMHISPSFLKSAVNNNPLYRIWNSSKYGSKLFYALPRRFSTHVNLKFY